MAEPEDDDLRVADPIVDQVGVGSRRQASDVGSTCDVTDERMILQQRDSGDQAISNAFRSLRRSDGDMV